ncbi:MAG: TatD family deoxyribonuclease [Firmicutes bacterium]|nr:TatD family deoxyribonuclease [Bacillota bacterium]
MNNFFIDTHAHIYQEYYSDINEVINNAQNKNVNFIINNGYSTEANKEVIELAKHDSLFASIGIHPEVVDKYTKEDLEFIVKNINHPKIVAIGEIGLDYHYTKENKEKQKELFEQQLKIAQDYNIPVIIHSRDATQDTIDCLKKYQVKGIIHSFSGSLEVANIYIKMGFLLGINGVITFKNSNLKEVLKEIDLKNIVLETDSPYLTPHPYRGTKNEPKYINLIAEFIADLKNVSKEELATITNQNIQKTFSKINLCA